MWRADSLEKTLTLGMIEGRRRGGQRMRLLDDISDSMGMSLGKQRELAMDREAWGAALPGVTKSQTWLSGWNKLNWYIKFYYFFFKVKKKNDKQALVLPMDTQDWSPLGWTGWISLQSKGLSRVFSNTTVQKHQFFGAQLSSQSNSHIHTWWLEKP